MKKALLVHPPFPENGFWNYKPVCALLGAKYPAPPLGLITVAGLFPDQWDLKLVDMNSDVLTEGHIEWADIVLTGGMLPQQKNILALMERIHGLGKRVVLGGPDPSTQPDIYRDADYIVVGEAEGVFTGLLDDLEKNVTCGIYSSDEKADLSASPVPRYDLLDFGNYLMMGTQFSRGCPFNCEFCNVVELFGRTPRTKSPDQVIRELERLYSLGYRGHVDFVDDNFIGNKRTAKEILAVLRDWLRDRGHPFYFSTEASINLADDDELLDLMCEVDFRYVFIGIESADRKALAGSKKFQNVTRNITDDLMKIYRRGIVVNSGFILGFDHETSESARMIVDTVEDGMIPMAMVGLLYALPNTQLTRRLLAEGRISETAGEIEDDWEIDQTTSGINFETVRPRAEILHDYLHVITSIYDDECYFDRVLRLGMSMNIMPKHVMKTGMRVKSIIGFFRLVRIMGFSKKRSRLFWRNIVQLIFRKPSSLETVINLMAMHVHFKNQTGHIAGIIIERIDRLGEPVPEKIKVLA